MGVSAASGSKVGLNDILFESYLKANNLSLAKVPYRDFVQGITDIAEGRVHIYFAAYAISVTDTACTKYQPGPECTSVLGIRVVDLRTGANELSNDLWRPAFGVVYRDEHRRPTRRDSAEAVARRLEGFLPISATPRGNGIVLRALLQK